MREALPNASFIGLTGTTIELTDKNNHAVFGDYISIYDIQRAVRDGATVPIYYESRLARLELDEAEKPRLDEEFGEITEGGGEHGEARPADRPGPREPLRRTFGSDGRKGHDRLHEPPNLRGSLRRHRGDTSRLARRGRRRGGGQGGDERVPARP